MLGLIAAGLVGAVGYTVHKINKDSVRKSNSCMVAKYFESQIDKGFPDAGKSFNIRDCDLSEVIKIMAEDGYNFFDYCEIRF